MAGALTKALGLTAGQAQFPYSRGEGVQLWYGDALSASAADLSRIRGIVHIDWAAKGSPGGLKLIHAIYTENSRPVFPDILYAHPLEEASVFTGTPEKAFPGLADKSAHPFFTAFSAEYSPDRLAVLRLVPDPALPLEQQAETLCQQYASLLRDFLARFRAHCAVMAPPLPELSPILEEIEEKLPLTVSQRRLVQQALENAWVYYGVRPDPARLPVPKGSAKRDAAAALKQLLSDLAENKNCIPKGPDPEPQVREPLSHFQHVYVTEDAAALPETKAILDRFPAAQPISLPHYKSLFNRPKQDVNRQSLHKNLILARAEDPVIYQGSDYCNAFGFSAFYYCSTVLGCLYDCDYCYLKGLYPTANITAFVNMQDFFRKIEALYTGKPMLICCSYDSDILALDGLLNTVGQWLSFARAHPGITFELRTKAANTAPFGLLPSPPENVILAFSLCPHSAWERYEHQTPSPSARIRAAKALSRAGWRVRLCFEPVLSDCTPEEYSALVQEAFGEKDRYEDVVLSAFRMNQTYFKRLRQLRPRCRLLFDPHILPKGSGAEDLSAGELICQITRDIRKFSDIPMTVFSK